MKAAVTVYYVVVVLGLGTMFLLTRDGTGPLAEPTRTTPATDVTTPASPVSPSPSLSPTPSRSPTVSPSPTPDPALTGCLETAEAWIDLTERWRKTGDEHLIRVDRQGTDRARIEVLRDGAAALRELKAWIPAAAVNVLPEGLPRVSVRRFEGIRRQLVAMFDASISAFESFARSWEERDAAIGAEGERRLAQSRALREAAVRRLLAPGLCRP